MGFEESAISSLKRNAKLRKGLSKNYFKNKGKYTTPEIADKQATINHYSLDDHTSFRLPDIRQSIIIVCLLIFAIGLLCMFALFWV